ncbi:MAG: mitochondrial fission ELM1 family protein, partial [Arenimonas sp.]
MLHDGTAGNRRQALALADALAVPVCEWILQPNRLARWAAPRRFPGAGFGGEFHAALAQTPPALAIGCGRLAALATRQARAAGARVVQILAPRLPTRHWDLVVAPIHDRLRGNNVVSLLGSLNPVDERWLALARERWHELLSTNGPRTAVLLGGPTAAVRFDATAFDAMCARLEGNLAREGGSLLLCASRRTPHEWFETLRARFGGGVHRLWLQPRDGENFYAGALACADRVVASPDSVNMLSEACATALPVFVAEPERARGRVGDFVQDLLARGRVRPQSRELEPFVGEPLRETA